MENVNKISIITVSLNSAETIERTILSVINQTHKDIEYIIIDGGSTDGTVDIIKKYNDRIFYWVSEKDNGISDAFNKGIKIATGDIVGLLNSDDWYEFNTIDIVLSKLNITNVDFVVGALRYWDKKGNNFTVFPDKNYERKITYKMPNLNHPASFFKKKIYDSVGFFNQNYKYAMDYDFFLRVYNSDKKGIFVNEILTNMRLAGISDKYTIQTYYEEYKITTNKFLSSIYLIYSIIKYFIRKILFFIGLNNFLFKIRKIKYKN